MIDLKSLALDIGAGTMDVLLYDDQELIENSLKMVVPSPTRFYAKKVRHHTKKGNDIAIRGFTIGGGQLTSAIRNHAQKNNVYMTPNAAYSLRNDLDEVKEIGVKIIDESHVFEGVNIFLNEIKLNQIEVFLNSFSETLMDVDLVAISVKDHGASPKGISNREFRMNNFEKMLNKDPNLKKFLLREKEIPGYYYRMRSNVQASKSFLPETDVIVMDTSPSAIMGCLMDPNVNDRSPVLAVNIGNGHTMAAVVSENRLDGLFEHHTSKLTSKKLEEMLVKFAERGLTSAEVFEEGGHGVIYFDDMPGYDNLEVVVVTGPKRRLMNGSSLDYLQATPGGDVMMTGTIGILSAAGIIGKHH